MAKHKTGLIKPRQGEDLSYISPDLRGNAVLAEALKLDPRNPRRGDVEMVAKSLHEFGQQKPIIVFRYPDDEQYTVIAGNHTTRAAMLDHKWDKHHKPPYKYIAVNEFVGTPEEAMAYGVMDNRSSDVATYDDATLAEILLELKEAGQLETSGHGQQDLEYLLSRIEVEEIDEDDWEEGYDQDYERIAKENTPEQLKKVVEYANNNDALFPSTNRWEIPDLLPEMLGEPPEGPIKTWPGEKYADKDWDGFWYVVWGWSTKGAPYDRSILSFYTDDPALWPLYQHPGKYVQNFVSGGIRTVIAPAFSLYMNRPFPERINAMYVMQWLARFYQECGIKVIPHIPSPMPQKDYPWMFAGIPPDTKCVSMQFQTLGLAKKDNAVKWYKDSIHYFLKHTKCESLILYGSRLGHEVTWSMFPAQMQVIRLATVSDVRRFRYDPDPLVGGKKADVYRQKYRIKKKPRGNRKRLKREEVTT